MVESTTNLPKAPKQPGVMDGPKWEPYFKAVKAGAS